MVGPTFCSFVVSLSAGDSENRTRTTVRSRAARLERPTARTDAKGAFGASLSCSAVPKNNEFRGCPAQQCGRCVKELYYFRYLLENSRSKKQRNLHFGNNEFEHG